MQDVNWIARVLQDVRGMSNDKQDHFGVQNVNKNKSFYPKVRGTQINYILSKYL